MIALGMFSRVHRTYKEKKVKDKKDEKKKVKDEKTEEKTNEPMKDSPKAKKVKNVILFVWNTPIIAASGSKCHLIRIILVLIWL